MPRWPVQQDTISAAIARPVRRLSWYSSPKQRCGKRRGVTLMGSANSDQRQGLLSPPRWWKQWRIQDLSKGGTRRGKKLRSTDLSNINNNIHPWQLTTGGGGGVQIKKSPFFFLLYRAPTMMMMNCGHLHFTSTSNSKLAISIKLFNSINKNFYFLCLRGGPPPGSATGWNQESPSIVN